ncbi:MAG TPA: hypothetical protein ENH27_04255, partial [Rhizobiales bacterium]|nr:hypothetical protein [Hyphomicrobiales bacterium]
MLKKFTNEADAMDRIQLVTPDAALAQQLQQMLSRTRRYTLETIAGGIADAERNGLGNAHPALLLVDLDPQSREDMGALERVMLQRAQGLPVIVLSQSLSESSARDFMRLRVSDWCPK